VVGIEGPLRELGIHDVLQLLDLSRKTGVLRVAAELSGDEGAVYFERGRVVFARTRSSPRTLVSALLRTGAVTERDVARARDAAGRGEAAPALGDALVSIGAVAAAEVERQARAQIDDAVFELMSWRDGAFSFEEGEPGAAPAETTVRVPVDSLLMEGARRMDEWSRMAGRVPHLGVVPALAEAGAGDHAVLDLRPVEWELLAAVDGVSDLRAIAASLAASEFEVARTAYGLAEVGVIDVAPPERATGAGALPAADATPHVERAASALAAGRYEEALGEARQGIAAAAGSAAARVAAARALLRLGRVADAADELRRAAQADPLHPDVQYEVGFAAARRGDLAGAVASWEHYLRLAPDAADAPRARAARDAAVRLRRLLEAHAGV
jgi:tetratricopeptide (TPR) repeat protein